MKHFENKFNFIVNNYANSSHVREVLEKMKELEKLTIGALQPHRSWRELVLILFCIGAVLFGTIKMGRKYGNKWISHRLDLESSRNGPRVSTVNDHVARRNGNDKMTILDLKNLVDEHMTEHKQQLEFVMNKLMNISRTTSIPTTG